MLPEKRLPNPTSPQAQGGPPQSPDGESHQARYNSASDDGDREQSIKQAEDPSPRRNIWARLGTGSLGIIGRIPHPEFKGPEILTSKSVTSAVTGALNGKQLAGSLDDFNVPSSTSTEPANGASNTIHNPVSKSLENGILEDGALDNEMAGSYTYSLDFTNGVADSDLFSQTRLSSDDLVESMQDTPSPRYQFRKNSPPPTPSPLPPPPQMAELNGSSAHAKLPRPPDPNEPSEDWENASSPRRIPKYKVALTTNILSPTKIITA